MTADDAVEGRELPESPFVFDVVVVAAGRPVTRTNPHRTKPIITRNFIFIDSNAL